MRSRPRLTANSPFAGAGREADIAIQCDFVFTLTTLELGPEPLALRARTW